MIVHLEGSLAATYRNKIYDEFFSSILIITYVLLIGGGGNGESPWKYVRNTDIITSMLWS